jgi:hypothetical protein
MTATDEKVLHPRTPGAPPPDQPKKKEPEEEK